MLALTYISRHWSNESLQRLMAAHYCVFVSCLLPACVKLQEMLFLTWLSLCFCFDCDSLPTASWSCHLIAFSAKSNLAMLKVRKEKMFCSSEPIYSVSAGRSGKNTPVAHYKWCISRDSLIQRTWTSDWNSTINMCQKHQDARLVTFLFWWGWGGKFCLPHGYMLEIYYQCKIWDWSADRSVDFEEVCSQTYVLHFARLLRATPTGLKTLHNCSREGTTWQHYDS